MVVTHAQPSDVVILGPVGASRDELFNAVHALYYLPLRYTLVLPAGQADDAEIMSLIERDALMGRVHFDDSASDTAPETTGAVFIGKTEDAVSGRISGDSAEALASAILRVMRERVA